MKNVTKFKVKKHSTSEAWFGVFVEVDKGHLFICKISMRFPALFKIRNR